MVMYEHKRIVDVSTSTRRGQLPVQVILQQPPPTPHGAYPRRSSTAWDTLDADTLEAIALSGAITTAAPALPSLCSETCSAVPSPPAAGAEPPPASLALQVAEGTAAAWAAASGALGAADPPPAQAALTCLLLLLLAAVGNAGVDRSRSLVRSVLQVCYRHSRSLMHAGPPLPLVNPRYRPNTCDGPLQEPSPD